MDKEQIELIEKLKKSFEGSTDSSITVTLNMDVIDKPGDNIYQECKEGPRTVTIIIKY